MTKRKAELSDSEPEDAERAVKDADLEGAQDRQSYDYGYLLSCGLDDIQWSTRTGLEKEVGPDGSGRQRRLINTSRECLLEAISRDHVHNAYDLFFQ
jgi:hypothetical protein